MGGAAAAEDAGRGALAAAAGGGRVAAAYRVVAGVDRGPVAHRLPAGSGLPGVPRGDLPVDLRPAGRHAGPRVDLAAVRAHRPPRWAASGAGAADPRTALHRPTAWRGRGAGGAGALGRRPRHRHGPALRGGNPGRTHLPVPGARPADRARRAVRRGRRDRRRRAVARAPAPVTDLGRWRRDGPPRHRHRHDREYFPTGVEITSAPASLTMVAAEINDRPRKRLFKVEGAWPPRHWLA